MTQGDILGGARVPPVRKPDPPGKLLTGLYVSGYERRHGEKPIVQPGDGKLFIMLASQFGVDLVAQRLDAYIAWDDPYIAEAGWPVYLFKRCWNRLAQHCLKTSRQTSFASGAVARGCTHKPPCRTDAEHTQKHLKDMRGA